MQTNNIIVFVVLILLLAIVGTVYFLRTNDTSSLEVISPKEGDVWNVGATYLIKWNINNIPPSDKISVTIRRVPPPPIQEEGQEFDPIIFTNLENTGSKEWTISNMYPSGTYVLGLASYSSLPMTDAVTAESAQFKIENQKIGGQKDEFGCLTAAGYSWCEATSKCIRPWETYCTGAPGKTVTFKCDLSKTITATFYPTDDKFVDLVLSDGISISLPRTISASGARYATDDESLVFWNKGDTAFITEKTSTTSTSRETYSNCSL